jgi:arsenate reductase (thioredoxin)
MTDGHYSVLFVCTHNSARSIMGESLMNYWGSERFCGYSAGSHPRGQIHPLTLELLSDLHLPVGNLRSKSWNEFTRPGAQPPQPSGMGRDHWQSAPWGWRVR